MNIIGTTLETIVAGLNQHSTTLLGKAAIEFNEAYLPSPLTESIFTLGVYSSQLGERIKTMDSGGVVTETTLRPVTVKYKLTIYMPYNKCGSDCLKAFDDVISCIVKDLGYNVVNAGCEDLRYSSDVNSIALAAHFSLSKTIDDTI